MGVRFVVAVTDHNWFGFLRKRQDLEEVNFWKPKPGNFNALQKGELFLFKLGRPTNMIVGGGVFHHAYGRLPCSLAWKAYGDANGASSEAELKQRIARLRSDATDLFSDFEIGCRILAEPFFFNEDQWIEPPPSWKPQTVQFKGYSTEDLEGRQLWDAVRDRLQYQPGHVMANQLNRYGEPRLVRPRIGQGIFRDLVTESYGRRCAVTHERTVPVLEAAHIRPYSQGGPHEESNGLLLRRDIHALFDRGLVTVTPDLHFEVSQRIRDTWDNGKIYYDLQGASIHKPHDLSHRPDPQALSWHNEKCFR